MLPASAVLEVSVTVEAGLAMPLLILVRPQARVNSRRGTQLARQLNCDETLAQRAHSGKNHQALVGVGPALDVSLVAGGLIGTSCVPTRGNGTGVPTSTWEPGKEPF